MSESTRERILKRRHEDLGHHGAHPGLSFNCTLADDLRLGRLVPNCAAMLAHRRLVALRGVHSLNHIEVKPNSATVEGGCEFEREIEC